MDGVILAIDAGTTSVRCMAFDSHGKELLMTQRPLMQYYPGPGMVEQDPMEIRDSCIQVTRDCISGIGVDRILAVGITNQRETTIVWDRETGVPIHPAIVWQDRRTHSRCESLCGGDIGQHISEVTGLHPDAYFSATKLEWILHKDP